MTCSQPVGRMRLYVPSITQGVLDFLLMELLKRAPRICRMK